MTNDDANNRFNKVNFIPKLVLYNHRNRDL